MNELGVHRGVTRAGGMPPADRPTGRRRSDRIVGSSRATQEVVEKALAAAAVDLPVYISGATGSGKQHLARAIHAWSRRSNGPLVVLSCAATAAPLAAREIFGCAASVYPSLPEAYDGVLDRATNGTVVIDGFDRLSSSLQEPLLKAIQAARFQREGDSRPIPLRARVIVTSIQSPSRAPFGDLPHQTLDLLPLSERTEDILPLAAHFLRLHADEDGIKPVGFTAEARVALTAEPWPGNVRELAERVRQAGRLAGNGAISAEALILSADGDNIPSFKEAKRAFETRYVTGLLRRCAGNISRAARLAKKDRKDFYDVIRRTGVDPSEFRN